MKVDDLWLINHLKLANSASFTEKAYFMEFGSEIEFSRHKECWNKIKNYNV